MARNELCAILLLCVSGRALATESGVEGVAKALLPVHLVVSVVDVREPPTFRSRLASWFPQDATVTVSSSDFGAPECAPRIKTRGVAARLTFPAADRASLLFAYCDSTSASPHWVLREASLPGGMDELGQERLAQIIHTSTMALVEGRVEEAGTYVDGAALLKSSGQVTPTTPHRPLPEALAPPLAAERHAPATLHRERKENHPSPRQPFPSRVGGWLGVGYSATLRGVEGVATGPQLTLGLDLAIPPTWACGALIEARRIEPNRFEHSGLSIQTSGLRALGALQAEVRLSSVFSLAGQLGAGLDVNRYVPLSSSGNRLEAAVGDTDQQPFLTQAVRLYATGVIDVGVGFHLDAFPSKTHYLAATSDGKSRILATPWQVQPGMSIALRLPGRVRVTR